MLSVYKNLAAGESGVIISSLMAVAANGKGVKEQICMPESVRYKKGNPGIHTSRVALYMLIFAGAS